MDKRISSRGVIIQDNQIITLFRRKKRENKIVEYYAIPGGGLEENETIEECVVRELKEELSVDVEVEGYIGKRETDTGIQYYFGCKLINGTPILGGEEKERNNPENYYEIRYLPVKDLYQADIEAKDLIQKAINKEYSEY